METIALVACGSKKTAHATTAADIYLSTLFKSAKNFAEAFASNWYILSAKHGVIQPLEIIEPYDETLNDMDITQKNIWGEAVIQQLTKFVQAPAEIWLMAGKSYREPIEHKLIQMGYSVHSPLSGLGIGQQVSWLQHAERNLQLLNDLKRFYSNIKRLSGVAGQGIKLADAASYKIPLRGIYLFQDESEYSRINDEARIVRIGTHAVSSGSKSTLWQRLRTHRGTNSLSGNHRSSIFRLHVGAAILRMNEELVESWGKGDHADRQILSNEQHIETEVSKYIRELKIFYLPVQDEPSANSDRAYLERNIIGLLSSARDICKPSRTWLGLLSPRAEIQNSGLWNLDHLNHPYSPEFLDVFEQYINILIGGIAPAHASIAPNNWWTKPTVRNKDAQLDFFKGDG